GASVARRQVGGPIHKAFRRSSSARMDRSRARYIITTALSRGLRMRCPHCGQGRLFSRWARHLEHCSVCGLVYERNPGDTWAFTIVGDRLPVAAVIALGYFDGFRSHPTWWTA